MRSQACVASADCPSRAIDSSTVGRPSPGALPPPTADDPLINAIRQPLEVSSSPSAIARASMSSAVTCNIRWTGTVAVARPATYSASVASRMANVILSARRARISGWVRSRSTSAREPAMMPACGPPSSLSPLKQTRSTPAASEACTEGSPARSSSRQPLPMSSITGTPTARPACTRSASAGRSVKPSIRKFDGCTRRNSAVAGETTAV